ncbi:MAG: cytochrome c3 family protein, partial [Gemmatimonadota bacterium]
MRKLVLLGSGTTVLALAGFLAFQSNTGPAPSQAEPTPANPATLSALEDTSALKGPRQPIFFRHDIHAGQYKIQCQYCHYTVAVSPEPGIPSVETCMGCHLVIAGSDSGARTEIRKLRQASAEKKPIEWTRIHALARHVHFPHNRHIKAMGPTACMT